MQGIAKYENILKNAHSLFNTGKHHEAYKLYNDVLNLEPDNVEAQFYRELSSTWETDITKADIGQLEIVYSRALDSMFRDAPNSVEFFTLTNDMLIDIQDFGQAYRSSFENYKRRYAAAKAFKGDAVKTYNRAFELIEGLEYTSVYRLFNKELNFASVPTTVLTNLLKNAIRVTSKNEPYDLARRILDAVNSIDKENHDVSIRFGISKLLGSILKMKACSKDMELEIYQICESRFQNSWNQSPETYNTYNVTVDSLNNALNKKASLIEEKGTPSLPLKRRMSIEMELVKIEGEMLLLRRKRLSQLDML